MAKRKSKDEMAEDLKRLKAQQQGEEVLRGREQYLQALIENCADGIAVINADGSIRYESPCYERMLGHKPEGHIGGSMLKHIHPDDIAKVADAFEQLRQNPGGILQVKIRAENKDGSWHLLEAAGRNLLHDPVVQGIVVNYRDITERQQAEEALRKSEERYRILADNVKDAIFSTDIEGHITYISPSVTRLLGYTVEEAMSHTLEDSMTPASRQYAREGLAAAVAAGYDEEKARSNIMPEFELYRKDGTTVWIEASLSLLHDSKGRLLGTVGSWRDITERKQAEEALRKSEERYRLLAESMNDVIWSMDMNLRYTYLSPSAERQSGYTIEEAMAMTPEQTFTPESVGLIRKAIAEEIAREKTEPKGRLVSRTLEVEAYNKDGSTTWVEVQATFVRDRDGNPVAIQGVTRNISERKRAEEKLRELYDREKAVRQELEEEMQKRVNFTRALIHELKTPLTSVMASSDLMVGELSEGPLLNLAKNINRGAANLGRRIDELLDIAKGEVGMLELMLQAVPPREVLYRVAEDIAPVAAVQKQSLVIDAPSSLRLIQADEIRLRQVLLNLVSNAFKYAPEGGVVTVRAREEGDSLILEVEDNGPGISEEEQEHLFNLYHRGESDRGRYSGLGIGLALCKTLVELHGGRIWVRSQRGKGSTFGFSVPLATSDE